MELKHIMASDVENISQPDQYEWEYKVFFLVSV